MPNHVQQFHHPFVPGVQVRVSRSSIFSFEREQLGVGTITDENWFDGPGWVAVRYSPTHVRGFRPLIDLELAGPPLVFLGRRKR